MMKLSCVSQRLGCALILLLLPLLCQCSSVGAPDHPLFLRHLQTTPCVQDSDCKSPVQFCSLGECRESGTCGRLVDCQNPANLYVRVECVGFLKCTTDGRCATECGNQCPNGDNPVNCFAQPCAVNSCDEPYVTCLDDYCGGCNAIFINATGHQVCQQQPDESPPIVEAECTSDSDCTKGQYCGAGTCQEAGTCSTVLDCQNPSNVFPMIECVGFLKCTEGGRCAVECSGSFCPNGDDVECKTDPCSVTKCDEPYVSCVDNYCGGCNAIFINATGHQVCENNEIPPDVKETECMSDSDCTNNQYCGAGSCLDFTTCSTRLDCQNPANVFDSIQCVGLLQCIDGLCSKECDGKLCPNGGNPVNCFAQPCAVTRCDEPYVSCLDDYCGGCNAVFLNATGHQVCQPGEEPPDVKKETECSSDADCAAQGQYCAAGICQEARKCSTVLDCHNPSNIYPDMMCVGYKQCVEGQCSRNCTGSFCPNNDDVKCLAEPCSVTQCSESYVSCVNDYCGGCNAIFFNATGHEVCVDDPPGKQQQQPVCASDADCPKQGQYCSTGRCYEAGHCGTTLDCHNPSNEYATIACVGFLKCTDGLCGKECDGNLCPNGDNPENCFAKPCSVTKCDEPYVSCIDDNCGGCNAIFLNATGHQVCQSDKPVVETKCSSDADCTTQDQYCGAGTCQDAGTCSTTLDCHNPANVYPEDACVGYKQCVDEKCTIQCTGSFCPNSDEIKCTVQPCDMAECDEPYVSCINDICGGCNAIFFNSAGIQVCADGDDDGPPTITDEKAPPDKVCEVDDDCDDENECSEGKCQPTAEKGAGSDAFSVPHTGWMNVVVLLVVWTMPYLLTDQNYL